MVPVHKMATLRLAQVGYGGMGLRHVYGLIELKERVFATQRCPSERNSGSSGSLWPLDMRRVGNLPKGL
jgi:hypothetical protein